MASSLLFTNLSILAPKANILSQIHTYSGGLVGDNSGLSIIILSDSLSSFLQSIKNPKIALRYFQDLLGKHIDNPQVALYRWRFPQHELVKDERRQTVIFKLSQ